MRGQATLLGPTVSKPQAEVMPVILCGGTGTRFWPLSRASYPKQYWALAGAGEETLLQQTQQRLAGINGLQPPLLICNEDHRFNCFAEAKGYVAEQMRQIGVEPAAILLEPMGRNTAPAVAVAALQATARGEDPLLLVLAADHVIEDAGGFRAAVEAGTPAAEAGQLVTFGIVPTAPETGYGYIEAAQPLTNSDPANPAGLNPVPIARYVRGREISDVRTSCFTANASC
jgi:mannose-1-phosphate guanylyltransferase/mannose-6-phosphate isomerase